MDMRQRLDTELKDALRSKDETKKRTIRLLLSSIKIAEAEKGTTLDDIAILTIIQKEIKTRRESILDAQKGDRQDLIALAEEEIAILETYLPKPFTDEELIQLAKDVIQEIGASSPTDMGKVMKVLLPRIQGKAGGDKVSQVVKQLLQ